ncbi:hypothetical protein MKC46_00560 [[Clostridium] innocuum]|nr:hypothetical protein [[Clostridium] innocuum]
MLLPRLADYFNVSIDYLFGRGKQEPERLSDLVFQKLKGLKRSKQLELAFEICYMMENAIGKIPHHEALPDQENVMMQEGAEPLLYQVLHDDVYSCMRLNEEFHYFLYVPQPSCGFLHALPAQEEFEELLAFLDKPHCFAMLYQLSKCPQGRGFQVKGLAKKLSIEEADAAQILQDLKKRQIVHEIQLEKEKGLEPIYVLSEKPGFLPMLLFMAAYIQSGILYGYFAMDRELPILNGEVSHE